MLKNRWRFPYLNERNSTLDINIVFKKNITNLVINFFFLWFHHEYSYHRFHSYTSTCVEDLLPACPIWLGRLESPLGWMGVWHWLQPPVKNQPYRFSGFASGLGPFPHHEYHGSDCQVQQSHSWFHSCDHSAFSWPPV